MTLNLPEVEAVDLTSNNNRPGLQSASINLSNDYGTPNLLFLSYTPFLPDDSKVDYDAIKDEVQSWNAWELGQAETQLITHVQAGSLPSDDSTASRVRRNNYRSKAVSFFRANSQAWLSIANSSSARRIVNATQDGVNGAILRELRSLALEHGLHIQFGVVLNVINGSIHMEQNNEFYFTHVHYKYNSSSRRLLPVILDTTFTVGKQGSNNRFTVTISLTTTTYNFDRNFWRANRNGGRWAIDMGEPIRKQMALDFHVNS